MAFPDTSFPDLNTLWSSLILEELVRHGVRHACIAPGSRCAPLIAAAYAQPDLQRHSHFDERGLGFFALGLAKSTRKPVLVITTSGTAVANLHPAMIEAAQSGCVLVVISADRPVELLDCGANQAIDQLAIFGSAAAASLSLPVPDSAVPLGWLLSSVDEGMAKAESERQPLHINCPFREPLYPAGTVDFSEPLCNISRWCKSDAPFTRSQRRVSASLSHAPVPFNRFADGKGVIVAGQIDTVAEAAQVVLLAKQLGWPMLTDLQSQLHGHEAAVGHCDLLLASRSGKKLLGEADRLLQVGAHLISKRLLSYIGSNDWMYHWMVAPTPRRIDPCHSLSYRFVGTISDFCDQLESTGSPDGLQQGLIDWRDSVQKTSEAVGRAVADGETETVTERWLGEHLFRILPDECTLFVGNSLPVRMLDLFSSGTVRQVYTNRGASGIDGLIATAAGCAAGTGEPVVAVVGDLSFLHDLNSLTLLRALDTPFVLLVINNDGGGIFHMLPLEHITDGALPHFFVPHGLSVYRAGELFGIECHNPVRCVELESLLREACNRKGSTLIEVTTRSGDAALAIGRAVERVSSL